MKASGFLILKFSILYIEGMVELNSSLLDYQCEQLLLELRQILTEKWPLATRDGADQIRQICDSYSELFDASTDDGDNQESRISQKNFLVLTRCNEMCYKLTDIIKVFIIYCDRLVKLVSSLSKLLNADLNAFNHIDSSHIQEFLDEVRVSYRKELALKQLLVEEGIFEARHNQESRVALLSCWILEPYLSESLSFKLKTFLDTVVSNKI